MSTKESADEGERDSDKSWVVGNDTREENGSDENHSNNDDRTVIHGKRLSVWRRNVGNRKK